MTWTDVMKMQAWVFNVRFVTMTSWCSQFFFKIYLETWGNAPKIWPASVSNGLKPTNWPLLMGSLPKLHGIVSRSRSNKGGDFHRWNGRKAEVDVSCTNESFFCATWKFVILRKLSEKTGDFEVSRHLRCQIMYGVDPHQKTSGHGSCHHFVDTIEPQLTTAILSTLET